MEFYHKKNTLVAISLLLVFGILFAMVSLVNHYYFRTYGLDLGLYTNALYDYIHFHSNDSTFFLANSCNLLADHFDLYLMLFSPLVLLLGSYTLLVLQIVAVLMGMWGMYRLAGLYTNKGWLPMAAMLMVGLSFGVWHALAFDYHSNVVAAMMLPWMLYFVKKGKPIGVVVMAVLMSIGKETSALWVIFVLVALLWDVRRNRQMRRVVALTAVGILAYFLSVTMWIMPSLGCGASSGFWRYDWMGTSVGEVALWVVSHPIEAVRDIFVSFLPDSVDGVLKVEFFICILTSGLLLGLFKPNYLFMLISPLALKMLSRDSVTFWGVSYQYNIEICMVTVAAAMIVLSRMKKPKMQNVALLATVLLTGLTLVYTVSNPKTWVRKENIRLYDRRHYNQADFDRNEARRLIESLPSDASVAASSELTPHLALRDKVYLYPEGLVHQPEYLLLTETACSMQPEGWGIVRQSGKVILLVRQ